MAFTFKRNAPTGPYRSFFQSQTEIKIRGQMVGIIQEGRDFDDWSVRLKIRDTSSAAGWRWATLKARFADEAAARVWLQEKFTDLTTKFDLVGD